MSSGIQLSDLIFLKQYIQLGLSELTQIWKSTLSAWQFVYPQSPIKSYFILWNKLVRLRSNTLV